MAFGQQLGIIDFSINRFFFHEFGVPALRNDLALLEHNDPVGIDHGADALGNDESCTSVHECLERGLDMGHGSKVHTGGGVVEDEDARVEE